MTDPSPQLDTHQLSVDDRQAIDHLCDEFERLHQSGQRPDVNEFADRLPNEIRLPGLIELVILDAHYRSTLVDRESETHQKSTRQDESFANGRKQWSDYVRQFPELQQIEPPNEFSAHASNGEIIAGRFQTIRPFASGGLGQIQVASDLQLKRNVAIKQLRPEIPNRERFQQRFVREAEITGQLEHPGIVPVYVLGTSESGEPFYAMRLIEGKSLAQAITELHSISNPTELRRRQRNLINRLIDVCNTIEYAHSRGFVHRDIKPPNIMLGEFGETLLVDWGLAKRMHDDPDANLATSDSSQDPVDATRAGTVMGTAGFMSPEQARGDLDKITHASDIFSLGATLFHLLTGERPPILRGSDFDRRTFENVISGPLESARVSRPLAAICKQAMALEPDQRYQSARELAQDLESSLADEPVSVYRDSMATRLRRQITRHPALAATGLATICLTMIGLAVFSWLTSIHAAEVNSKNDQLDEMVKQEQELRVAAEASQRRSSGAMDYLVNALRSPDPYRQGYDVRVLELLNDSLPNVREQFPDDPLMQAQLLKAIGTTFANLEEYPDSILPLKMAYELYHQELGERDAVTLETQSLLANSRVKVGESEGVDQLQQALNLAVDELGDDDEITLRIRRNLSIGLLEHDQFDDAVDVREKLLAQMMELHGTESDEAMTAIGELAEAYGFAGDPVKAAELAKRAYLHRKEHDGEQAVSTLMSGFHYARFLSETNEVDQGTTLYERLLPIARETLGDDNHRTLMIMRRLAVNYMNRNELEKAIPLAEESWETVQSKYGEDHTLSISSANTLATAFLAQGDFEACARWFDFVYQQNLALWGPNHSRTLTTANNLASAYRSLKQYDRANDLFRATLAAQTREFGRGHPRTLMTMVNLAGGLQLNGDNKEAVELCRELAELAQEIEPDHLYAHVAMSLEGDAHLALEDYESAEDVLRRCLEIRERTLPDHWLRYRTESTLGEALLGLKSFEAAEKKLVSGYDNMVRLKSKIPAHAMERLDQAREGLIRLYEATDRMEQADQLRQSPR